jgi:hypothetical protein
MSLLPIYIYHVSAISAAVPFLADVTSNACMYVVLLLPRQDMILLIIIVRQALARNVNVDFEPTVRTSTSETPTIVCGLQLKKLSLYSRFSIGMS